MFNKSKIPSGVVIEEAYLYLFLDSFEGAFDINVSEVNSTWDDVTITRNNQPCGTNLNDTSKCNVTTESTTVNALNTWFRWNITRMVRRAYSDQSRNYVSMIVRAREQSPNAQNNFASKENANSIRWPRLNITYVLSEPTPAAIGTGVQNALLSNYTNYTNQMISARSNNNSQFSGLFDWVAKKGSKVWAFNYIGSGESHIATTFNLTPSLYILQLTNATQQQITLEVEMMINATK